MALSSGQLAIATGAESVARTLPFHLLQLVAESLASCDTGDWPQATGHIAQGVAHPHYRNLVAGFLDIWRIQAAEVSPQTVAVALLTAAQCERENRERQSVELVWTGPGSEAFPFRRTEQAILQVLDSARHRITVVSYAVYRIQNICDALVRAARRGVQINVIVETPDQLEGENEYNTLRALGEEVANCAAVYFWPRQQRVQDGSGKVGILHVKCAVADGHWLFLSSANLTEYAFTINMELGLLVKGGPLSVQVEEHFDRLIGLGTLAKL